jgi:hypothetical protein
MKCQVGAALFPERQALFPFLCETFGMYSRFPDLGDSTQGEILDLGLEEIFASKSKKVFGIKRRAEPTLLVIAEQAVKKAFTVQINDEMFNDWVRQHQSLLFGIAYWWTGSRTEAEELTLQAFLRDYPRKARIQRHSKRSPRHREIAPHLRLRLAPRRGNYERPSWEIVSRGA